MTVSDLCAHPALAPGVLEPHVVVHLWRHVLGQRWHALTECADGDWQPLLVHERRQRYFANGVGTSLTMHGFEAAELATLGDRACRCARGPALVDRASCHGSSVPATLAAVDELARLLDPAPLHCAVELLLDVMAQGLSSYEALPIALAAMS